MTVHFLLETMESRRKWQNIFQFLKEKSYCESFIWENIFEEFRGNQDLLRRTKLRLFVVSRPTLKKWLKGGTLNRKWMMTNEEILDHRKKEHSKKMGKNNRLSLVEFSKLFLIIEEKCIILSKVILNVCRRNIKGNYIINVGG